MHLQGDELFAPGADAGADAEVLLVPVPVRTSLLQDNSKTIDL